MNLNKVEDEFDKHEIENSMNSRSFPPNSQEFLNNCNKEEEFLKEIVSNIEHKYEKSEFNPFKVSLTK